MKKILKSTLKKQFKRKQKRIAKEYWIFLREIIKINQHNKCYMCGKVLRKKRSKHIHHIVSRKIKILAFDSRNLVLLCPYCHKLGALSVHSTAIYFSEILRNKEPERYEYLLSKINNIYKV